MNEFDKEIIFCKDKITEGKSNSSIIKLLNDYGINDSEAHSIIAWSLNGLNKTQQLQLALTNTIFNWSLIIHNGDRCIQGYRGLTTKITTLPIQNVKNNMITTIDFTNYWLSEPSNEYIKWLQTNGILFDKNNPLAGDM